MFLQTRNKALFRDDKSRPTGESRRDRLFQMFPLIESHRAPVCPVRRFAKQTHSFEIYIFFNFENSICLQMHRTIFRDPYRTSFVEGDYFFQISSSMRGISIDYIYI